MEVDIYSLLGVNRWQSYTGSTARSFIPLVLHSQGDVTTDRATLGVL